MTEQTDEEKFLERCQFYIIMIEKMKVEMAAFPNDTKWVNERQKEIAQYKSSLAKHLGDRSVDCISASGRQRVTPCWIVSGQPQKRLKSQAREWMAARGLPWTGAPDLREAVQDALEDGDEQVPEGYFGLRVEQTVKFE
jgi:hypothetical protein